MKFHFFKSPALWAWFFTDEDVINVPLAWSWRLTNATPEQRKNFQIIGNGQEVHWLDVDEDISAIGMLDGIPTRPAK